MRYIYGIYNFGTWWSPPLPIMPITMWRRGGGSHARHDTVMLARSLHPVVVTTDRTTCHNDVIISSLCHGYVITRSDNNYHRKHQALTTNIPVNTRNSSKGGPMLGQLRRRWANIYPTLNQLFVFAGIMHLRDYMSAGRYILTARMKGCIGHMAKWQIHPFITAVTILYLCKL